MEERCPVISGGQSFLFRDAGADQVGVRLRSKVVSNTAAIRAAP
jgi:hypothetical protein